MVDTWVQKDKILFLYLYFYIYKVVKLDKNQNIYYVTLRENRIIMHIVIIMM